MRPRDSNHDFIDDDAIEKTNLEEIDYQELARLAAGYQDVKQYVEDHEYEIVSAMSQQDWLHVYSKAI